MGGVGRKVSAGERVRWALWAYRVVRVCYGVDAAGWVAKYPVWRVARLSPSITSSLIS